MEANKYCQCCGMPLTDEDMLSREADGSINDDYCKWCYADGTAGFPDGACAEYGGYP